VCCQGGSDRRMLKKPAGRKKVKVQAKVEIKRA
jgi:hypothetical protein